MLASPSPIHALAQARGRGGDAGALCVPLRVERAVAPSTTCGAHARVACARGRAAACCRVRARCGALALPCMRARERGARMPG